MRVSPHHLLGEDDFPPGYRERLRLGSAEERKDVIEKIINAFPARSTGAFLELIADTYGDRVAVRDPPDRKGPGKIVTYRGLLEEVRARAMTLLHLGVRHGERVGIVAENSIDTLTLKLACEYVGAIVLPWTERIEDAGMTTSGAMERAHIPYLALHGERSMNHVLGAPSEEFPHIAMLRKERRLFGVSAEDQQFLTSCMGSARDPDIDPGVLEERLRAVGPEDTASILYSPGTGGLSSKMVEVSHANMLYQYCVMPEVLRMSPGLRYLHVLPPYHIFGATILGIGLSTGGDIMLADLRSLQKGGKDLLKNGRFQLFAAIPDFWRHLRAQIESELPAFVRCALEEDMRKVAREDIDRVRDTKDRSLIDATEAYWKPILDRSPGRPSSVIQRVARGVRGSIAHALYPVLRQKAGLGSFQWGISGGAKLPAEDYAFFSAIKGTPRRPGVELHSGYGLTEAGVCSITGFGDRMYGATVGDVLPGTAAWTDETIEGMREICIAGPGVSRYRDSGLQQELIPGGVLHTGDQGKVLTIRDRVSGALRHCIVHERQLKRMVKWKGASMLPAPMEALLKESPLVDDALVTGDGQNRLGVLIFPNHDVLEEHCLTHPVDGFDAKNPDWDHPGVRALFKTEIESRLRIAITRQRARVDSFRIIGEFPQDVRMASGILHPRRTEERFAAEIAELFGKVEFAISDFVRLRCASPTLRRDE